MRITAVAAGKGGIGKTTTAAELVAELARRGVRVGAIDLDQQGNLSTLLGIEDTAELPGTTAEVLAGECSTQAAAVTVEGLPGVELLAGDDYLRSLAGSLSPVRIRDLAQEWESRWDHVVIDCPPALDNLTLAAIVAADDLVSPVAPSRFALDGLARLAEVIAEQIAPQLNPAARVSWVVPMMVDGRRRIDRESVELLAEDYHGRVTGPVRRSVAAEYAAVVGQPVSLYDPRAAVAQDYRAAAAQILG